jgi:hypothetical protein
VSPSALSPARWAALGLEPSVMECRTCARRYTLTEFLDLLFVGLVPEEDGWVLGEKRICHCGKTVTLAVACMLDRPMARAGEFTELRVGPVYRRKVWDPYDADGS